MRKMLWMLLAALTILLMAVGCGQKPKAELTTAEVPPGNADLQGEVNKSGVSGELTVYIPCGMIIPIRAVMDKFEADNPGVKLNGVFDNAVILADKLTKKGEKADVFISPGSTELARITEAGLAEKSDAKSVGSFELVVITNRNSPLVIEKLDDLKKCKTISSPDPAMNSVGASGKQALTNLGLWDELQPKMVLIKHAIESHTMVASGKSDAGIAYRNCPLETNPEKLSTTKVQVAFSFPEDSYERQQCLVIPLKDSPNPEAAKAFVDFISSKEGREILAEKGMTGCLDMDMDASAPSAADAVVSVRAFFPGNESHKHIKEMIEALPTKYDGKVSGEFIDFTSDEGFDKWQAAGLSCGAILINDEQTWSYEKNGKPYEVTFKMAMGGEWNQEDLYAVIDRLLAESEG